jgi:hypothetical protein
VRVVECGFEIVGGREEEVGGAGGEGFADEAAGEFGRSVGMLKHQPSVAATRKVSSAFHGAGLARRRRYSKGWIRAR